MEKSHTSSDAINNDTLHRHSTQPISQGSHTVHHSLGSPTDRNGAAFTHNAELAHPRPQQPSSITVPTFIHHVRKPSSQGLSLHTEVANKLAGMYAESRSQRSSLDSARGQLQPSPTYYPRRSSITSRRSLDDLPGALSPPSSMGSPALGPLIDVTPLPSPLYRSNSPELWRRIVGRRRGSSGSSVNLDEFSGLPAPAALQKAPSTKKKAYTGLGSPALAALREDEINPPKPRSVSEYVPDPIRNVRPRNVTNPLVSATADSLVSRAAAQPMHREDFLAGQKRKHLVPSDPAATLPSPPPSNKSAGDSDEGDDIHSGLQDINKIIRIHSHNGEVQRWKPMRQLGQGAFSQVFLAARDYLVNRGEPDIEKSLDPSQLVAIKVVTHDKSMPAGDEARMETSIGREIEILESLSHPCLPQLLAFDDSSKRAVLVLNYCPGGDMFELASQQRNFLTPGLIQRICSELVEAVGYLHRHGICHRDIKLENVLFDLPLSELPNLANPQAYPRALVTLTDLGLAKKIPPESPLLVHHCGSIDYAAPELLLQKPYDGRSTDMWALGVLFYALMEGRLPFDPLPGRKRQASVNHRIARCEWVWVEHGDEDGEWQESKGKGLTGGNEVVEGMLKKVNRGRWSQQTAAAHPWIKAGIQTSNRALLPGTASPQKL